MNEARFHSVTAWLKNSPPHVDADHLRDSLKAKILEALRKDCPHYPDRTARGIAEDFFDPDISFMPSIGLEFNVLRREWFKLCPERMKRNSLERILSV